MFTHTHTHTHTIPMALRNRVRFIACFVSYTMPRQYVKEIDLLHTLIQTLTPQILTTRWQFKIISTELDMTTQVSNSSALEGDADESLWFQTFLIYIASAKPKRSCLKSKEEKKKERERVRWGRDRQGGISEVVLVELQSYLAHVFVFYTWKERAFWRVQKLDP